MPQTGVARKEIAGELKGESLRKKQAQEKLQMLCRCDRWRARRRSCRL